MFLRDLFNTTDVDNAPLTIMHKTHCTKIGLFASGVSHRQKNTRRIARAGVFLTSRFICCRQPYRL
jgi:hypothetical protein